MMQDSKLSRYVDFDIEDTLSPRPENQARALGTGPVEAPTDRRTAPNPGTLTPINILKRIRDDIVRTFGFHPNFKGGFSNLEETLIQQLEMILRKGHSPACLVWRRETMEALLCLSKYFSQERVTLQLDPRGHEGSVVEVLVFRTLYQHAREAAFCDQKIKEIHSACMAPQSWNERESQRIETIKLKKRRDRAVTYYQKIIFTDGERLRQGGRRRALVLFGKKVTLEDLIRILKTDSGKARTQGDRSLDSSMTCRTSVSPTPPGAHTDAHEAPAPSDHEVLDWRQIKDATGTTPRVPRSKSFDFKI